MSRQQQDEKKVGATPKKESRPITAAVPVLTGPSLPGKLQKELNSGAGGLECIQVQFFANGVTETGYLVNGEWMGTSDFAKSKTHRKEAARAQEELHAAKGALNKIRERFLISFPTPTTLEVAKRVLACESLGTAGEGIFAWSQKRFDPLKKNRDGLVIHLRKHEAEVKALAAELSTALALTVTWAPRLSTEKPA